MTRGDVAAKARAVFLAAIMVLSVVAMSAAFTGSAVASATSVSTTGADLGGDGLTDITVEHDSTASASAAYIIDTDGDGEYTGDDLYGQAPADSTQSTTFADVDVSSLEAGTYDVYVAHGASGESDEPTADDGVDITESGWAQSSGTLNVIDVTVSPDPDQVVEDQITTVDVTVGDHPDGVEADYTVETPSPTTIDSGTTATDGSFSFTADPPGDDGGLSPGDEYTVTVDYSGVDGYSGSSTATVLVAPSVNLDAQIDPANPIIDNEVTFTGSLTADDGERPDEYNNLNVVYGEDPANTVAADLRVLSNGDIEEESATLEDAGTYSYVYDSTNGDFIVETFTVGSEQGDLTLDGSPVAGGGADDFNIELTDAAGDGIELTENALAEGGESTGTEGFVAVEGNFSAIESEFSVENDATLLRVVGFSEDTGETTVYDIAGGDTLANVETNEDKIVEFHALNTADGQLNFSAEATTAEQTIDTSLATRTDEGDGFSTDELATGGVENATFVSYDTLDLLADADSVEVETGDDLSVDTSGSDDLSVDGTDQTVSVSVTGSDFSEVDETADTVLDFANVTITSDQLVGDSPQTVTVGAPTEDTDQDAGPVSFDNLNFEQGGEVLVEVTAEEQDDQGDTTATYTYNETLDVAGDTVVDYSPSEVTSGTTQDVSIQIANADGTIVADRDVTFAVTGDASVSGDAVSGGDIVLGPSNFDTSTDAYVAENITFETPGDLDLAVQSDGTTTVDVASAITISGEERYDVRTEDELLAGSADDVDLEVYNVSGDEETLVNDSTELDELANNIELSQGGDTNNVGTGAVSTDAENGTITVADVVADGADVDAVNVTVETADASYFGDGDVTVVEPEITTSLAGDSLTEGVTSEEIAVNVLDPRDGSPIDGDVQFTANGTSFFINNTDDDTAGTESDVADEGTFTFALGTSGQANVTVAPDAIDDAANTTLVVEASPDGDGPYFGASDVDAGNLQIAEREGGQDVELRDEIAYDSNEEITFVLRDANDDRLDERDVTLNYEDDAGEITSITTDEGFFAVNFSSIDLIEGDTINFDAASDYNGDITAATVDVTEDLEEVQLNASVANETVTQGEDFEFTVTRSDFEETTRADLTFTNESGDDVLTASTGGIDTDDYGVVDTSDLEAGDYTVEVSKSDSDTKTFLNDSVDVSVATDSASVTFSDQTVENGTETITVDSANYELADGSDGDYQVAIHVVQDDGDISDVVGVSANQSGAAENIEVDLNSSDFQGDDLDSLTENATLQAMLHETGSPVGSPLQIDGELVTANADITVVDEGANAVFEVSDLQPADATVDVSQEFDVSATITNTGDLTGEQDIELRLEPDGAAVANQTVSLDAAVNETVTFENVSVDQAGEYNHTIASADDAATGSLTVEGVDEGPALDDYQDGNGDTSTDLLRNAISDWRNDDISTDLLREVIGSWRQS